MLPAARRRWLAGPTVRSSAVTSATRCPPQATPTSARHQRPRRRRRHRHQHRHQRRTQHPTRRPQLRHPKLRRKQRQPRPRQLTASRRRRQRHQHRHQRRTCHPLGGAALGTQAAATNTAAVSILQNDGAALGGQTNMAAGLGGHTNFGAGLGGHTNFGAGLGGHTNFGAAWAPTPMRVRPRRAHQCSGGNEQPDRGRGRHWAGTPTRRQRRSPPTSAGIRTDRHMRMPMQHCGHQEQCVVLRPRIRRARLTVPAQTAGQATAAGDAQTHGRPHSRRHLEPGHRRARRSQ